MFFLYLQLEKQEYDKWAEDNNLPEELRELGWNEFLED